MAMDFWKERVFSDGHDEMETKLLKAFKIIVLAAVVTSALIMLSGCKSVQYVPVETVRTDTLFQKVVERDSIHVHDSVTIREKGDTVYRSRVDSVQVPYPVEKKLTRWQQVCIDYGKLTMGATVVLLVFVVAWIVRRLRKTS